MYLLLHEVFDDAADTEVGTDADAVINEVFVVVIVLDGENENDCGKAVLYIDNDDEFDDVAAVVDIILAALCCCICCINCNDEFVVVVVAVSVCDSGVLAAFVSASSAITVSMMRNDSGKAHGAWACVAI